MMEMSLRRRCLVFVNLLCVGQEYSLALRKLKKARVKAAQYSSLA